MSNKSEFNKSDLYVYELSTKILSSLNLISFDKNLNEVKIEKEIGNDNPLLLASDEVLKTRTIPNPLFCNTCNIPFGDQQLKREHYKTDFHVFNVKRKLHNLKAVNEIKFETLITDAEPDNKNPEANLEQREISSSDEDSTDSVDSKIDLYSEKISNLDINIKNYFHVSDMKDVEAQDIISHLNTRSAQIFFNSALLSDDKLAFGAYKSLFNSVELESPLDTINGWNETDSQESAISALFMIAGGHFAGAIVSHQKINVKGNQKNSNETLQEQAVSFLEKKTFHRYTTRRKQGGSQSAYDNAKGKADSAGSTLRRYNELALKEDINKLLQDWSPYLVKCQHIFIRANSIYDKKIFTDSEHILKGDQRIKTFPFPTNKPSLSELKKAWCELTYLKKCTKPEPILVKAISVDNSKNIKKTRTYKDEIQVNLAEMLTDEALMLLRKGRAPLLMAFLKKNKLDVGFPLEPRIKYDNTPTLLHYASQQGLKQMVGILATTLKADLSAKNKFNKTPYEVSKTDAIKQAFQIVRYNLGESYTNWELTKIDEPLSRDEVEEMNNKKEATKAAEVKTAIEEELQMQREKREKEMEEKRGVGNTIGSGVTDSTVKENLNLNSLNEEQRKRLMREQRARAAEARLNAMQTK